MTIIEKEKYICDKLGHLPETFYYDRLYNAGMINSSQRDKLCKIRGGDAAMKNTILYINLIYKIVNNYSKNNSK